MALAPRAGVDSFTSRLMQTKDYEPSVLREVIEAQEQAHLPAWSRPLTDLLKKWVVTGTVDAKATCLSMDAACAAAEALDGVGECSELKATAELAAEADATAHLGFNEAQRPTT